MRFAKFLFPMVFCLTGLLLVSSSIAEAEFYLLDGTRAVIIERHLLLIRPDSGQKIARPGSYQTRDGRTILVSEKGVVIQERKKELR